VYGVYKLCVYACHLTHFQLLFAHTTHYTTLHHANVHIQTHTTPHKRTPQHTYTHYAAQTHTTTQHTHPQYTFLHSTPLHTVLFDLAFNYAGAFDTSAIQAQAKEKEQASFLGRFKLW
jgi:hypothetical protein